MNKHYCVKVPGLDVPVTVEAYLTTALETIALVKALRAAGIASHAEIRRRNAWVELEVLA